jgi:hypothetical protein
LDKLLLPPFVVLLFHHLLLPGWRTWMDGWQDGWRDEWMERTTGHHRNWTKTKDIIYIDKNICLICFHFFSILKCLKKKLIVKVIFCFYFFPSFFPFKNIYLFCFFLFCYNFVSFYLFINNLFPSFLIWNFLCCFKKISSLVSHFFSTIFSVLKLVCNFWQIVRL